MRRQSAFTFGELGTVLAATGIVLAVAYSAYRSYIVRSQISEGIALANELIPTVTEYFRRRGDVPPTIERLSPGVQGASPFVDSVTIADGRIDVLYGGKADRAIAGRSISLTPYETVDRHVVWICGNRMPGPGLEPLGFASGGAQAMPTLSTLDARYLPDLCR